MKKLLTVGLVAAALALPFSGTAGAASAMQAKSQKATASWSSLKAAATKKSLKRHLMASWAS